MLTLQKKHQSIISQSLCFYFTNTNITEVASINHQPIVFAVTPLILTLPNLYPVLTIQSHLLLLHLYVYITEFASINHQPIAFVAELEHDVVNPPVDYRILFTKEILNLGHGYVAHNGEFTAPVKGLYHFAIELSSVPQSGGHTMHVCIMKNNDCEALTYLDSNTNMYLRRTGSILLELDKYDYVWAKTNLVVGSNTLHSGGHYNMFSGFLIQQLV